MGDKGRIIWTPQPKQLALMRRFEDEALYGGAAGGGKSDCALAEALRQVGIPHYRGILLRKTYPQLSELMDRSTEIYKNAFPAAKFNDSKHVWSFPSGAKIYFGAMQHTKDRTNYQGKRFDFIDFDELTQFNWDEYSYMFSRNRPNGPGTRCYIRAQANPGGIGHGWVKERFILPVKPLETFWERIKIRFPDGHEEVRRKSRVFVPSSVFDNKILMENDPGYIEKLAGMSEQDQKALLYGDWDSFSGQVFTEWRRDPDHYTDRVNTHVIAPFQIPASWAIWRGFDWGYARPFSVGWYAVDHDRRLYRIRELYGCSGEPNVGLKWEPSRVAQEIRRIEAEDPNIKGHKVLGVADPAIFNDAGNESVATLMEREQVYWTRGDNRRIDGKMQVHHRLCFDEGLPLLYVFSTCRNFIRTVPSLVYSQSNVEDVDTDTEDHIYDELRYVCMANPIAPPKRKPLPLYVYNPLDDEPERDNYGFYQKY